MVLFGGCLRALRATIGHPFGIPTTPQNGAPGDLGRDRARALPKQNGAPGIKVETELDPYQTIIS